MSLVDQAAPHRFCGDWVLNKECRLMIEFVPKKLRQEASGVVLSRNAFP